MKFNPNKQSRAETKLNKLGVLIAFFLTAQGVFNTPILCRSAQAAYGFTDALETVGISAGIGTVLGASTMAFYNEPFDHFGNALIGAGVGVLAGLGVAAYLMAKAPSKDELDIDEVLPKEKKKSVDKSAGLKPRSLRSVSSYLSTGKQHRQPVLLSSLSHSSFSAARMRPVDLLATDQWAIAFKVLELRF